MRWIHSIWDELWSRTVNGRLNRKRFVLWMLGCTGVLLAISISISMMTLMQTGSEEAAFMRVLPIYAVAVALQFMLSMGRMHDLGYSGWQTLGLYAVLLGLSLLVHHLPLALAAPLSMFNMLLNVGALLIFLFRRGTKGPNRFGPDPLERVSR